MTFLKTAKNQEIFLKELLIKLLRLLIQLKSVKH